MIVTPDASVLLKWVLPGDDEQAGELLASFVEFGLTEARLDARWRTQTLALAVTYKVAFHDAAYHAVALGLGGVFVTADERYVRRVAKAGNVLSLQAWRSQL
ncbi:MAG: type II toxin-antitoxin system VapC family toxin [Rhodospirillaceae bacterium]|nr:type II toxin-antitoxin system VapC family toxin [Rhodospirillaceae bacterium]